MEWFTNRQHQGFSGSKIWGHISKAWKAMVKGTYQLPPRTKMELLHSNIWWSEGVDLLNKGIDYAKCMHLYRKGIRCVDDVWDSTQHEFLSWESAQGKFKLMNGEQADWEEVTGEISRYWRRLLNSNDDTTYPGQWVGFYVNMDEDPAIVIRCGEDFAPECFQRKTLTLPLPVQCYTVGTHSRCLREWEHPQGELEGFFHKVKIIRTKKGPKREKKKRKLFSSTANLPPLGGTQIGGDGGMGATSLITPPRTDETISLI